MHFITNGGDSLERLNEIPSVKFKKLNFATGLKNIFYQKWFYHDLKDYVNRNKINIIHTHHRFPELVSVKIAEELNIKTIASSHSYVKGFKKLSFKSDKIISVSKSIASHMINDFNVDGKKILTLYNPVDETYENQPEQEKKLRSDLITEPHQKILLFVGRISYDKGVDTLLKSFKSLIHQRNDLKLIICGSFHERNLAQQKSKQINNLMFLPPRSDIYSLYKLSDMIILPSRIDMLPFVMLEAGIFKKPFIGGNTGGIAEFIEDGVNGLLVDPENPQQLAEKIIFLLDNENFAKNLGENLYKKVKDKCDYNNYFNKVEEIYKSLV